MKAAKFCPVCWKCYDSNDPMCPIHDGVLMPQVYDYGEGFVVYECGSYPLSDIESSAED